MTIVLLIFATIGAFATIDRLIDGVAAYSVKRVVRKALVRARALP